MKNNPLLTVLSFSGGKQSSALLWMVLLGLLDVDLENFAVINADPGMENSLTYDYVDMMFDQCREKGIYYVTVKNGNLYEDIINLKNTKKKRLDNPPYWTRNKKTGSMGRLRQSCTLAYKIIPYDREIRNILERNYGISKKSKRIGNNIVEKWIGFTYSEIERIKPSPRKYWYFSYPLIDMKWTNDDVINFYSEYNLPIPPRSVCNACFANGLSTFKEMYDHRPEDWKQAINVDNSIRDWSQIKIKDDVFVSNTLIPLEELAENDFDISKIKSNLENDYSCDSGYCFL